MKLFGLKKRATISAVSELIKELKNADEVPEASSRQTLKRAREREVDVATPHGPIMTEMQLPLENGGFLSARYCDLAAYLHHTVATCEGWGHFFEDRLEQAEGGQSGWQMIVYADEVSPGNQLRKDNRRKFWAVYASWKELGGLALSKEASWNIILTLRSNRCAQVVGGFSTVMRHLVNTLLRFETGVQLRLPSGKLYMFQSKIAVSLADEGALKHSWQFKGAAGTLPCFLCRNVLDKHTGQASTTNVTIGCHDPSRFQKHTNSSLKANVRYIAQECRAAGAKKDHMERVQQCLGLNYVPTGLLFWDKVWDCMPPVDVLMFDWMHIYLVHGCFQLEVSLLTQALPWRAGDWEVEMRKYIWPKRLGSRSSATGALVFDKYKDWDFKCGASEGLSCYRVLRNIVAQMDVSKGGRRVDSKKASAARKSFLMLCRVLDMLPDTVHGPSQADELEKSCSEHLDLFKKAYGGEEHVRPKHHMAQHLGSMLRSHGNLYSCFVHERKHKEIKRIADDIKNHGEWAEAVVMRDQAVAHLDTLRSFGQASAAEALKKAPKVLREAFADAFDLPCDPPDLQTARAARLQSGREIYSGDVCACEIGGRCAVCQIWAFAMWSNATWALVAVWPRDSSKPNSFNKHKAEAPAFLPLLSLTDVLIYKDENESGLIQVAV